MDSTNLRSDLFVPPRENSCLIIALTDESILRLLDEKEIFIGDSFNTIIIKYVRSID